MRHASRGEQPRVLAVRVPGDRRRLTAADADQDDPPRTALILGACPVISAVARLA
jgi:hypothetical protein